MTRVLRVFLLSLVFCETVYGVIKVESRYNHALIKSLEKRSKKVPPIESVPKSWGDLYFESWRNQFTDPTNVGIGVVGNNNGEKVFSNNALRAAKGYQQQVVSSGDELLKLFEKYTSERGCIPKIIFAGHGWSYDFSVGGPGLPLEKDSSGFYENPELMEFEVGEAPKPEARYLADLEKKVGPVKATVEFCKKCLVEVHSCNVSENFAQDLARISQCQVVIGRGAVSPVDTPTGKQDHEWVCYEGFRRFTPKENTVDVEDIGMDYVAQ